MRHGSLFSGVGGFDLAATWMEWDNVFNCERDRFCRRVLKHYWPETKSYEDVREFKAAEYRGQIDVLSGGFPCQPFSQAGKRKGTADDRYLWPQMCRIVREIQPNWVVGENVFGLLNWNGGMVFRQVLIDLEAEGYEVWPYVLPAAGVGAPHRRDRIFFVAHALGQPGQSDAVRQWREPGQGWRSLWREFIAAGKGRTVADTQGIDDRGDGRAMGSKATEGKEEIRPQPARESESMDDGKPVADADSEQRLEGRLHETRSEKATGFPRPCDAWDMGNTWQDFPTQSPICCPDDGLPRELDGISFSAWRKESLKAYGNAIVPKVALQIFRVIEWMEQLRA
jgi:DNA (cytosine-5)-methyltransferase 1